MRLLALLTVIVGTGVHDFGVEGRLLLLVATALLTGLAVRTVRLTRRVYREDSPDGPADWIAGATLRCARVRLALLRSA